MNPPEQASLPAVDRLFQSQGMVHPFDLIDEVDEANFELFAEEVPEAVNALPAGLATDCGQTLSTIACDCLQTLSTLFCLSCEGCSG